MNSSYPGCDYSPVACTSRVMRGTTTILRVSRSQLGGQGNPGNKLLTPVKRPQLIGILRGIECHGVVAHGGQVTGGMGTGGPGHWFTFCKVNGTWWTVDTSLPNLVKEVQFTQQLLPQVQRENDYTLDIMMFK